MRFAQIPSVYDQNCRIFDKATVFKALSKEGIDPKLSLDGPGPRGLSLGRDREALELQPKSTASYLHYMFASIRLNSHS
jgi:hypothetical protein